MFENKLTVKIQLFCICPNLLFMATCLRMNSPVNQTNRFFFHRVLSYSVEFTSCVYTKTIIHLRLS